MKRRSFLQTLGATVAAAPVVGLTACQRETYSQQPLRFTEISHAFGEQLRIAPNYSAQVLLSWGDSLIERKSFQPTELSVEEQRNSFGFNNDFIAFMSLSDRELSNRQAHFDSGNSQRGLLCVNHEYTLPHLMFSGYADEDEGGTKTSERHTEIEKAACGHSVVEIALHSGEWEYVVGSSFNRRITVDTPMLITGPAAGSERLKTTADPSGREVLGTVGNCAGGKTPWGTVLIAEENFAEFFSGDINAVSEREQDNFSRFGLGESWSNSWGNYDDRFNIGKTPNEPNRFGWMVEFDPYDRDSIPKKRTALGRFEHEGSTLVCKEGKPVVAYSGDDSKFQFVYKFVSRDNYRKGDTEHNSGLLEEGTLYAARFDEGGVGRWLPLLYGKAPLNEENGFTNQADVLIESRRAAELLGATPMDRPEDIETNPVNDCTYVVLTKNRKREQPNSANLRARNAAGHILEIVPPVAGEGRDHSSEAFAWNTLLLGGDPNSGNPDQRGAYGKAPDGAGPEASGWLACPDNLAFDPLGNMWVATDGCERFGFNDGIWALATEGEYRAIPRHFLGCPSGAEACGPEFTPDGKTLFVSIQHPADSKGSSYDQPAHRWPDFDEGLPPRPSVVAIRRRDGGPIGG